MKANHSCFIPRLDLPNGISTASRYWRCQVCGQFWKITYSPGSHCAARSMAFFPNVKLWRWRRRKTKEIYNLEANQ